jgi:hypothetical protein
MTLIDIAGGVAVPTLACAENPPGAIDSYVAAFMASISEQTSAIELRDSHYLNNGLVNSSPRERTKTTRTCKCDAFRKKRPPRRPEPVCRCVRVHTAAREACWTRRRRAFCTEGILMPQRTLPVHDDASSAKSILETLSNSLCVRTAGASRRTNSLRCKRGP